MMRKILLIIGVMAFGMSSYAQDGNTYSQIIRLLNDEVDSLKHEYESLKDTIDRFSQRSFSIIQDEHSLERYLETMTLSEIYDNREDVFSKIRHVYDSQLAKDYRLVIGLISHLNQVYDRDSNEADKKILTQIRLLEVHRNAEFKAISTAIKDYRFAMFELARVFRLIDKMDKDGNPDSLYDKLRKDGQLIYIYDHMTYAIDVLKDYISYHFQEEDMPFRKMKELCRACPEAFPESEFLPSGYFSGDKGIVND